MTSIKPLLMKINFQPIVKKTLNKKKKRADIITQDLNHFNDNLDINIATLNNTLII